MIRHIWFAFLALVIAGTACDKKSEEPKDQPAKTEPAKAEPAKAEPAKEEVTALGKVLAGAEEVTVAALLKDPKAYEGKTVRVAGKIEDWCHHKRAWFGVTAEGGKGMVRVFTAPRFQAPADCMGKHATAEGKVEIITISPEHVAHYGKDHKFLAGVEVKEGQPVHRPVVRAFGAELR